MKYNLKSFRRVAVRLPQHSEVKKIYSYAEQKVYINVDARPGANIILYEAPRNPRELPPENPVPQRRP